MVKTSNECEAACLYLFHSVVLMHGSALSDTLTTRESQKDERRLRTRTGWV